MKSVRQLHHEAMAIARHGDSLLEKDQYAEALVQFRHACELEKEAAELLALDKENEPTRSILYNSAASLAYQAKDYELAERLVFQGLSGYPNPRTKTKLKELYEEIDFYRHLEVKGVALEEDGLQMSLTGLDVGHGVVLFDAFEKRVSNIIKLLKRTFFRLSNQPFTDLRKKGSVEPLSSLISAPRPGSFSVTIKLTKSHEKIIGLFEPEASTVIEEVLHGVELINKNQIDELKDKVGSEAYFNNFMSLAKDMAPDGEHIKRIGFTSLKQKVVFDKKRSEISQICWSPLEGTTDNKIHTIVGSIYYAHGTQSKIGLVAEDDNKKYYIRVGEGLEDFVRSYFGKRVKVEGEIRNTTIIMKDLEGIEE